MGRVRHAARSLLSGKHALFRQTHYVDEAPAALQILQDSFLTGQSQLGKKCPNKLARKMVQASAGNTLIVPRKGEKLPLHVMPNHQHQPWELLPMRAAAMHQYPNLFTEACLFFANINQATQRQQPVVNIPCTKVTLDLAKLLRNLGILSSFQVAQRLEQLSSSEFIWPSDVEPERFEDLALHRKLYLKLQIRWDALKPIWHIPGATALQEPLHTTDAIPFAVRHLSKPSTPCLMTAKESKSVYNRLPVGICIMYHHQLGLTCDVVTQHYNVPALALAHLALPGVQVAQIQAALLDKAASEVGKPLQQTVPLTSWSLPDWVARTLQNRAQALAKPAAQKKQDHLVEVISRQVEQLNKEDLERAQNSMMIGQTLHKDLLGFSLLNKLTAAASQLPASSMAASEPDQEGDSTPPQPGTPGRMLPGPGVGGGEARRQGLGQQGMGVQGRGEGVGRGSLFGGSTQAGRPFDGPRAMQQTGPGRTGRTMGAANDRSGQAPGRQKPGAQAATALGSSAGGSRSGRMASASLKDEFPGRVPQSSTSPTQRIRRSSQTGDDQPESYTQPGDDTKQ